MFKYNGWQPIRAAVCPCLLITMQACRSSTNPALTARSHPSCPQSSVPHAAVMESRGPRWRIAPAWAMLWLILTGCLVTGCTPADLSPDSIPEAQVPENFSDDTVPGPYDPAEWWKTFNDPALDRIVEAALTRNFDLAEAIARVDQARARADCAVRQVRAGPAGRSGRGYQRANQCGNWRTGGRTGSESEFGVARPS